MTTTWINQYKSPTSYLLKEDSGNLLLENGSKIVLEQTGTTTGLWTNQTKN